MIPPTPTSDQEKLYRSSDPLSGSTLYYITIKPSTTTSITAAVNETHVRSKTNEIGLWR
jgi:hypothetical protein